MPRFALSTVLLTLLIVGCGESTKDRMYRMAREQAAAIEAEEAEAAKIATEVPDSAPDTALAASDVPIANNVATSEPAPQLSEVTPTAEPASASIPQPTTEEVVASSSEDMNEVQQQEQLSAPAAPTFASSPPVLSPDGNFLAIVRSENQIDAFDIKSRKVFRSFVTPGLKPTAMAFDEDRHIVVGTAGGSVKVYKLITLNGLDEFTKARIQRGDGSLPSPIHSGAVTSVAVIRGNVLSGDELGFVRKSSLEQKSSDVVGQVGHSAQFIQAYQGEQVFFLADSSGQVNFLRRDGKANDVRPFANIGERPVDMLSLPNGKGLAIVGENGNVSLSLPKDEATNTILKRLCNVPVVGGRFARNGNSLVLATATGSILEYPFPLTSGTEIKVPSGEIQFLDATATSIISSSAPGLVNEFSTDGKLLRTYQLREQANITAFAASKEGWVAIGDDQGIVHVFARSGGTLLIEFHAAAEPIDQLQVWSDGQLAYSSGFQVGSITVPRVADVPESETGATFLARHGERGSLFYDSSRKKLFIEPSFDGGRVEHGDSAEAETPFATKCLTGWIGTSHYYVATENGGVMAWDGSTNSIPREVYRTASGKPLTMVVGDQDTPTLGCDIDGNVLSLQSSELAVEDALKEEPKASSVALKSEVATGGLFAPYPASQLTLRESAGGVELVGGEVVDQGNAEPSSIAIAWRNTPQKSIELKHGSLHFADLSKDGRQSITVDTSGEVRFGSIGKANKVFTLGKGETVLAADASTGYLLTCNESLVRWLDLSTTNEAVTFEVDNVQAAVLIADKQQAVLIDGRGAAFRVAKGDGSTIPLQMSDAFVQVQGVVALDDGSLVVLDRTGRLTKFRDTTGSVLDIAIDSGACPIAADRILASSEGVVVVDTKSGNYAVLEPEDLSSLKRQGNWEQLRNAEDVDSIGAFLTFQSERGVVSAIDLLSGLGWWKGLSSANLLDVRLINGQFGVVSDDGRLHVVEAPQVRATSMAQDGSAKQFKSQSIGKIEATVIAPKQSGHALKALVAKSWQVHALDNRMGVCAGKECYAISSRGDEIERLVSDEELLVSMSFNSSNDLYAIDRNGKVLSSRDEAAFETVRNPIALHCMDDDSIAVIAPSGAYFYKAMNGTAVGSLDFRFKAKNVSNVDRDGCRIIDDKGQVHWLQWPTTRWTFAAESNVASFDVFETSNLSTKRDTADVDDMLLIGTKEGRLSFVSSRVGAKSLDSISTGFPLLGAVSGASGMFVIGKQMEIATLQGSKLIQHAVSAKDELVSMSVSETRDQLIALGADGVLYSLALDVGRQPQWKKLSVEPQSSLFASAAGDMMAFTNSPNTIQIVSMSGGSRELENFNRPIVGFDWSVDDRLAAVVDGTHQLRLLSAVDSALSKVLAIDNARFDGVAVHPGARTVAASGKEVGSNDILCFWDCESGNLLQSEKLASSVEQLRFSSDGSKCAVKLTDGGLRIYRFNGQLLNAIGADVKVAAYAFAEQGASVLVITEQGELRQERFSVQDSIRIGTTPIKQIVANSNDKWLVRCDDGTISCENDASWDRQDGNGVSLALDSQVTVGLSTDFSSTRVLVGGKKSDVSILKVWSLDEIGSDQGTQAAFEIPLRDGIVAVDVCNQGKWSLIAGNDNVIRMLDLGSRKIVATFTGHTDSVAGIKASSQENKFVSFDKSNVIKVWQLPTEFAGDTNEPIIGKLVSTSGAGESLAAAIESINVDEDPLDTARRALFSGTSTVDAQKRFYSEIDGPLDLRRAANQAAEAIATLEMNLASGTGDPAELARLRKEYSQIRRQLLPLGSGGQSTSLTDDHPNLLFSGETEFRFRSDQGFRPVHMRISEDRFLYAARSGEQFSEDDENKPAEPELGAVISWDFGFSGIKAHAWEFPNFAVSDVYSAPGDRGIFSFPNLQMFSNDGTSRVINTSARTWCVSPDSLSTQEKLLVVGQASPTDQQAPVLVTYKASELVKQSTEPLCSFSAFDGVVTAIAFANRHPVIAFAVRDRATTKVFLADPRTLSVDSMQLVYQHNHDLPYRGGGGKQGMTSLAFSHGDDVLVAHGEFEVGEKSGDDDASSEFRFNGWFIDWTQPSSRPESCFDEVKQPTPLLEGGYQAIRFLPDPEFNPENFKKSLLAKKIAEKSKKKNANASSVRAAGQLLMCYKKGNEIYVHDLVSGEEHHKVSIPTTQKGLAQFSLTAGGRWLTYGNDQGQVRIEDLFTKKSFSLTVNQRPAHTGPVVGVAIAEPDPKIGLPEFIATAGEENQVKVWDLLSVIGKTEVQVTRRVNMER